MDTCGSGSKTKSSARRTLERKEKQQQLQLEFQAQQRWQQTHGGTISRKQSIKNRTSGSSVFSSVFGNDEGVNTGCHVSECCSPTSDILGLNTSDKGLSLLGARPLGNIEKVLEYRTILNGKSVELRRVTASIEGPVEHLQVVNAPTGAPAAQLPALIMHQSQSNQQARGESGEKKSKRANGKGSKNGSRKKQAGEHGSAGFAPPGAQKPWLDYEGPPSQHAAVWNGSSVVKERKSQKQKTRGYSQEMQDQDPHVARRMSHSRQIQRLAMNGSQPCLMVATPGVSASADIHLHYPQTRTAESTIVSMDPNNETNTAKFIPIGSSNQDEYSRNVFDRSSFYRTDDNTANAQSLLHSTRNSPQKPSMSGRQQSLPRSGQQINVFHNGATHHHYFPGASLEHQNPEGEPYQYHPEHPPRPQSSAAIHQYHQQIYPNTYYPHQPPHGFDPYIQTDESGNRYRELEHVPTYEPFVMQPSSRELAGGSQPCLFFASSEYEASHHPADMNNRMSGEVVHSVVGMHPRDQPNVRSRASSSQSHVLPTKHGTATYGKDTNTRPDSSGHKHSRKKSPASSLKRVESAKPEGRHKQKSSSKKGHAQSEKILRRSESFTAASRGGGDQAMRDRRISSQQGTSSYEYQYNNGLNDSEIERMVLPPPPPPLNIEGHDLEFDNLNTLLPGQEHQQLQIPPSDFNGDNILSYQGQAQQSAHTKAEPSPSSPLAVIRRKRANQANWEKSRKESISKQGEKEVTSFALKKTAFQGIKVTPPSSFDDLDDINQKRYDEKSAFLEPKSDEDIIREHISAKNKGKYSTKDGKRRGDRPSSVASDSAKFKAPSLDLDLPPPPSPPCTCGKNLPILPPESMPPEINLMHGYMDGNQPQRPLSDHSRHPGQPPGTGEHHSSCASCSKSSQQLSLPRKGQKSSQRYIRDNYLTMPTRPTTRDDYRTEQDGHTSIRRGTSYHHLQGPDNIDFVETVETPKMVAFANGHMVEELSVSSPPTIISPVPVPRSGSFGSFARRYHRPTQHPPPMVSDPYADTEVPVMERPMSPRSAAPGFIGGSSGIPCATISNAPPGPMNNEQYPCDCCRIEDQQYMRDFTPMGTMSRRSEGRHRTGSASSGMAIAAGLSNGHCPNGIGVGSRRDSLLSTMGDQTDTMSDDDIKSSTKFSKQHLVSSDSKSKNDRLERSEKGIKKYIPHIKGRFHAKISENERGISLEFGKFVALISITGVRFRRQHWCLLSILLLIIILGIAIGVHVNSSESDDESDSADLKKADDEIQVSIPTTQEGRVKAVKQLLKEVPLIDGHNDLPWNIRKFIHNKLNTVNFSTVLSTINPWSESSWSHTDLYRLNKGHVGGQLWVAYAPCGSQHKDAVQVTLEQIDLIKRLIGQYPGHLAFVNDSTTLSEVHAEGKIASLISVESGHSIGTSLAVLRMFHRLGAISLTLTHNCNTPWADCSAADKPNAIPEHNGLSPFGKTVIKELNRLGMIIDLSHSSRKTSRDTMEASEAPVIFSHSSAFALCNSTRNVRDDTLKMVAKNKGLVMVNFFSYFLTCSNKSTINDVVAHLNHIKNVAGIDHVGIGASYDGINFAPVGLEDVSKYPELFTTLLASGMWTLEDLKKLAGLNFLRVFREVERVSATLRAALGPSEENIRWEDIREHVSCRSVAKRDHGGNSTTAC